MPDINTIFEWLWVIVWTFVLILSVWQLRVVTLDWNAIIVNKIQNGRRLIARSNLIIMICLVFMALFNLIPGINALLTPIIIPMTEAVRLVNIGSLIIAAILASGIILTKRISRMAWDKEYDHHKIDTK